MPKTTCFLPPALSDRAIHVELPQPDFQTAAKGAIERLLRSYCPACRVCVAPDEIHFTDGRTCARIVNVQLPR